MRDAANFEEFFYVNPDEILRTTLNVYRNCSSYQDAGEVSSDSRNIKFKTYFCRSNGFRFEWSTTFPNTASVGKVIFSHHDGTAVYFDGDTIEATAGLAMAVAGATGISLGVAPLIAHLLMPNLFEAGQYRSLTSLGPYDVIADENSRNSPCYRIRANWRSNCWTTLSVDKMETAIRKIEIAYAPRLEEKRKVVEDLELEQGHQIEELRVLLLSEEKPSETVVLYNDVKFDNTVPPELFTRV